MPLYNSLSIERHIQNKFILQALADVLLLIQGTEILLSPPS